VRGLLAAAVLTLAACAQINETKKAHELARTTGKYKVQMTGDIESVAGRCKFVRTLNADDEAGWRPTEAQLPDYFRTEAVYNGADTVVVRGRVAEAYICGPAPLNPDGTRKPSDAGPQ